MQGVEGAALGRGEGWEGGGAGGGRGTGDAGTGAVDEDAARDVVGEGDGAGVEGARGRRAAEAAVSVRCFVLARRELFWGQSV